jgi:DNA-binding transcriptional LysR family regulator
MGGRAALAAHQVFGNRQFQKFELGENPQPRSACDTARHFRTPMLPDIDSLALFVKAAELRSLTRAAESSHMGLAAASRRISLLEHRLKSPLLERSPKGVELTPAGATLLVHAKALLLQLNQMQADMDDHGAGRRGQLRIFANTSAMTQFVPDDLARFAQANPDVRLVLEERWSAQIVAALLAGEADVGIVMEGVSTEGLEVFPYRSDRLAVIVPQDHPLAANESVDFNDVLDYDLIALEGGSSMMRLLAEQAVRFEKGLRLRVQVRGFEVVCRVVQSGLGVGLLPFQAASAMGPSMGLAVRLIGDDWATRQMLTCVNRDRPRSVSLARLLDVLSASR